jgi:hypothetical protein
MSDAKEPGLPGETNNNETMPRRHSMDISENTTTASMAASPWTAEKVLARPEKQRVKNAVSSTARRVAEAEELLRKRKAKLREEQELMVLRRLAAERLGGDWSAKNRNVIFDALIAAYDL